MAKQDHPLAFVIAWESDPALSGFCFEPGASSPMSGNRFMVSCMLIPPVVGHTANPATTYPMTVSVTCFVTGATPQSAWFWFFARTWSSGNKCSSAGFVTKPALPYFTTSDSVTNTISEKLLRPPVFLLLAWIL
jgi:hypothetical protein